METRDTSVQEEENKASIWVRNVSFEKYGYIDNDQNEDDQERKRK